VLPLTGNHTARRIRVITICRLCVACFTVVWVNLPAPRCLIRDCFTFKVLAAITDLVRRHMAHRVGSPRRSDTSGGQSRHAADQRD
jgi:hypothetical protein